MKTFAFSELSEQAQANAINFYYTDSDYQAFIDEVQKENPDEIPMVEDWARVKGLRFNVGGELATETHEDKVERARKMFQGFRESGLITDEEGDFLSSLLN